jgi:hypothetical protein
VIGHGLLVKAEEAKSLKKGDNYHPSFRLLRDYIGTNATNGLVMLGHKPFLFLSDPDVISDMYMSKNKLFDKHPMV